MTLADYITERLQTPFTWGEHDCVCFAIGWLSIVAMEDLLAPYRPWTTGKQAARIIKKLGGLEGLFDANLKRIHPNFAQDGDITLVDGTAYLFSGSHIVGPGIEGLIFKNRMEATCAWSY
ncbi:MAG: hypothetical protein WCT35_04930 [Sideroxydans sp.]|jgi:hypothetical protein